MLPSASELTYFSEVAHCLNLSHAAKKIGISQPTLSMAIKKLEHTLGVSLFIRHKSGLSLTPAGVAFLSQVKTLLQQWNNILITTHAAHEQVVGSVTIGCRSVTGYYLGGFFASLLGKYPTLEIHLQHQNPQETTDKVINSVVDIGLVTDPEEHPDLIIAKIGIIKMGLWVGKGTNDCQNIHSGRSVIICEPEIRQHQFFIKQFQHSNIKIARMITTNSLDVVASLTLEGCGIGILPNCFAAKSYPDTLRPVMNMPIYVNNMCLIYRHENKHVQAIKTVINALKEFISQSSINNNSEERY